MGDSLGRKYYFGLLAALGHPSPLAHDAAAAKHEDLRFEAEAGEGGPSVAFYWRPYAKDVQAQVAQWAATGGGPPPDAVLLSFGLWDTLHETPPAEVDAALGGIAEALAGREGAFRAWLVPTAVVDGKLLTEEKRAHMTEAAVAAARAQARGSALPRAVDVVLDGAAVTQGLAARSEDGVHYDDGVYAALVQMGSNGYGAYLRGKEEQAAVVDKAPEGGKERRWQRQRQRRRVLLLDDVADWEAWEGEDEEADVVAGTGATHRVLKTATGGSSSSSGKPKEIDGSMSSPWHGAFVLLVVALMLLTMDPYAGFSWLGLCLARAEATVTWEEAYEPLLVKILRASPAAHAPGGGSSSSSGGGNSSSGVAGREGGAAVRGRYTPVPQEIELGGVGDQPLSPGESGPTPNEE